MMSKVVTIDARWLVGGIGTYTENLLRGLGAQPNGLAAHALVRKADQARVRTMCSRTSVVDVPIYTLREQLLVPRALGKSDLLHVPHFNFPLLHRGPLAVSILDVIHLSSPEYRHNLKSCLYARPMLYAAARRADRIVTVSKYSKAQIIDALGVPESKISVIYCGVGPQFRPSTDRRASMAAAGALGVDRPFLLYVGNLKPHKNVPTLLRAFAELRKSGRIDHRLLILGDDVRSKPSIVSESRRLGIEDATIFLPHVSARVLPEIYAAAELLVMPSTIEGFGLPVLEAMASGTPVVSSNAASLPEVGGDAVLYFDPASPADLAAQIDRVLQSTALQASLRDKGLQRAGMFCWTESTRQHTEMYRELLGLGRAGVALGERGRAEAGASPLSSCAENRP